MGTAAEISMLPSMSPSRPRVNLASICAAESASKMTTQAAVVLRAPHAQFRRTGLQRAMELPAEARARLEKHCAMAPASRKGPAVPQTVQQERMLAMVSA
jgi:hypothetical protein